MVQDGGGPEALVVAQRVAEAAGEGADGALHRDVELARLAPEHEVAHGAPHQPRVVAVRRRVEQPRAAGQRAQGVPEVPRGGHPSILPGTVRSCSRGSAAAGGRGWCSGARSSWWGSSRPWS